MRKFTLPMFVVIIVASLIFTSALGGMTLENANGTPNQHPFTSSSSVNGYHHDQLAGADSISPPHGGIFNGVQEISSLISTRNDGVYSAVKANSATSYSITFGAINKASGVKWSVYVYTNLSLAIPDLPLYNSLYNESYALVFSKSSSTSTITGSIASGTYYYYTGPSSTLTGPFKLVVAGSQSVSVSFPTLHTASFTETGLTAGLSWSVYGTASLPNGKMTILSETATTSTISVPVPNGYYDFAYGIGSTVIESYSFIVSGSNITRQISIPSLYKVTFQESGLTAGTQWQIFGETVTPNIYSFNNFFTLSSTANSASVEVPDGVYFYEPSAEKTTLSTSSSIYTNGIDQTISIVFPALCRMVFSGVGYRTDVSWQVSAYSTDGKFSSTNYSTSSTVSLYLPTASYTYLAGEEGASFLSGVFNVTSSGNSSTISFPRTYGVNLSETGLEDGMNWGVTIYGAGHVTSFSNITLSTNLTLYLPSGKYNYSVYESSLSTVLYQQDQSVYSSSSFTILNSPVNVSVTFPELVPTTFNETNLRSGITWGVDVYSYASPTGFSEVFFNVSSVLKSVTLYLINGTFYYSIEEAGSYIYPSVSNFNVSGTQQTKVYNFPTLYPVTFSISGLGPSTSWTLTVDDSNYSVAYSNSSSLATMVAYLPNASYNYSTTTTSQLSASSSFTVSGRSLAVPVTIAVSYMITFTETGLQSGTLWYVSVNAVYSFSSNTTIQLSEPNGTYQYSVVSSSYTPTPSNGTIVVSGKTISIHVTFKQTQATFSITFSEAGLPNGTTWSVTISNSTESSVYNSITVQEPNGTYTYEINATGFTSNPSAGLVPVKGNNQTVSVTFTAAVSVTKYGIAFSEIGLPANTEWTVSLTNSTNTGKIMGTISTTSENIDVYGITYDSSNRYLYASGIVQNSSSPTKYPGVVLVISPITNTIITTIPVGSLPESSVYNPYNGYIYTSNSLSNNVSVINTATETVIATIPVGTQPVGIAYSSTNNYVYVANGASGTVSVINGTSNSVLTTITLGSSGETLAGVVFDPSNGNVYVGGFNSVSKADSVFVINSTANRVVAEISGAAYFGIYDSLNGYLYFTDNGLNSVLVVDGSTNKIVTTIDLPSHSSPLGITYDSYDHNVYVAEQNSGSIAVIGSLTNTVTANLDVTGSPLFPTYNPSNHDIYLSNHLVGGIQVISSYGGKSAVQSSTGKAILFSEPNGTFSYSVGSINGYTIDPQSGSMTVLGSTINETISFSPVFGYEVTFSETGLRIGTSWSVTLGASTLSSSSSTITFTVTNGTYSYEISNVSGYDVSPTIGVVTVNGSSVTKTATFSELFPVNFTEYNLPTGATWTVTLAGAVKSSSTSTISFVELNGSYSFSVNSSTNYTISPSSGSILVNGATVNESVQFSPLQVSLYLSGTITPINATVYINGQPVTTVNGAFNISVQPGNYGIKVVSAGYATYYQNITVTSNQSHLSPLTITLSKQIPPTPLPVLEIVVIAVVVVAAIAVVSIIMVRTRMKTGSRRKE